MKRQVLSYLVGILLIRLINLFVKPFYISSIIAHVLAYQLKFHTITLYNCIHLTSVCPIVYETYVALIKSENHQHKFKPKPPVKPWVYVCC